MLFYRLTVTNREGEIVRRTGLRRSRSFVQQFMQALRAAMKAAVESGVKTTSGSTVTLKAPGTAAYWGYVGGSNTEGVMVGRGSTGVAMTDYSLETEIAHGSGENELTHAAVEFTAFAQTGDVAQFYAIRNFTNDSGSTFSVTESGLTARFTEHPSGDAITLLLARDVFGAAESLDDGDVLTVEYLVKCERGATNHFLEALIQHLLCAFNDADTACHDTGGVERTIEEVRSTLVFMDSPTPTWRMVSRPWGASPKSGMMRTSRFRGLSRTSRGER